MCNCIHELLNVFEDSAQRERTIYRWSNYRRSALLWLERNPVKGHQDMTQNQT